MKPITLKRKHLVLSILAAAAAPLPVMATPSATSPYVTDTQNAYVQDATSDGISSLNMVMCIMDAMKPAALVNQGPYVALVDKNKCDSKSQSSASNATSGASGATATPDYMNAVVDVTRASNSDPMVGKIWMAMTEQGNPVNIYVHLTATQSPTDAPPYGQFRLDYIGKSGGNTQFNGFIDANGAGVSYLETGGNSSNNALTLTANSTTSGSGTMQTVDQSQNPVTFNFAYDSSEANFSSGIFRRDDGTNDVCFDRSKAAASKSVWRYGTYNANDGTRVDQAHPGFPVQATDSNGSYFGYASYWGVNFQGLDLNTLPDGPIAGLSIKDQRPGNTTTYTLSKNSGKLTKWTQNQSTLSAMDGIPFSFWGDLTNQTSDTINVSGFGSWQMQWDNANGHFVVIGTQTCGGNGCTLSSLPSPATVTGAVFDTMPISGWSNSFGGNINIPPHTGGGAHVSGDEVDYYTQSDVLPGDSSVTTLHCLSNCPTTVSVTGFNSGNNSPFDSTTATQWGTGTVSVDYSFDSSGLKDSGGYLAVINANKFTGQYQNGVMSGRLFDTALPTTTNCPNNSTVCEPGNPSVYYTWQTGDDQWNQSLWLTKTSDSSVVSFDPPETVAYTVPNDSTTYGTWAGKSMQLQFNGFGNLQGIPGSCVNPTDNSTEDCGTAGARYVPEFSIPDGATMTLTSSNTPLVIKALDAEMRLAKVACASTSLARPTTSATLPSTSGVHDPSSSSDAYYLGTKPTVTDAPKVIHGVMQ